MDWLHQFSESVCPQCTNWIDESIKFLKLRLVTLSDPTHVFDGILEHMIYAYIIALTFDCLYWIKDTLIAKFKLIGIENTPRLRKIKIITFCRAEGISRKHRFILFGKGIISFLRCKYKENQSTTRSNYFDFKENIKADIELGERSRFYGFKMLLIHHLTNPFQDFVSVIDVRLIRCIFGYLKARFF
jgi:hypothetical protein